MFPTVDSKGQWQKASANEKISTANRKFCNCYRRGGAYAELSQRMPKTRSQKVLIEAETTACPRARWGVAPQWAALFKLLTTRGETMGEEKLQTCLTALMEPPSKDAVALNLGARR